MTIGIKAFMLGILTLFVFSGCSSKPQLMQVRNRNIHQSIVIQKQQQKIALLQRQLMLCKTRTTVSRIPVKHKNLGAYPKPKKNITLKKVEDHNYSSDYMYPDDKKKRTTTTVASTAPTVSINKTQCIAMIGEAKFNRYTEMFGNEAAAIKRCAMIQALKK